MHPPLCARLSALQVRANYMLSEPEVAVKRQRLAALPDGPPRAMGSATARSVAVRGLPAALRNGGDGGGLHGRVHAAVEPEGPECRDWEDGQCGEKGVEEYVEDGVEEEEDGSAGGRLGFRPHDDGDTNEYV